MRSQLQVLNFHFEDYKNANLEGMLTRWSEELTVLTNDGTVGLSDVKDIIPLHHTMMKSISLHHTLMKMSFMLKQIHILMEKHGLKHGISGMLQVISQVIK